MDKEEEDYTISKKSISKRHLIIMIIGKGRGMLWSRSSSFFEVCADFFFAYARLSSFVCFLHDHA